MKSKIFKEILDNSDESVREKVAKKAEEILKNKAKFKEAEIKTMLQMVTKGMISFSRFVELINERIMGELKYKHK